MIIIIIKFGQEKAKEISYFLKRTLRFEALIEVPLENLFFFQVNEEIITDQTHGSPISTHSTNPSQTRRVACTRKTSSETTAGESRPSGPRMKGEVSMIWNPEGTEI